jgi:hypothetical protein
LLSSIFVKTQGGFHYFLNCGDSRAAACARHAVGSRQGGENGSWQGGNQNGIGKAAAVTFASANGCHKKEQMHAVRQIHMR